MNNIPPSRDLAVKYALENDWENAYKENLKLLDEQPNNKDTLNRIAHALFKLAKYDKAKQYYLKVIKIDKSNPIAVKNIKRLESLPKNYKQNNDQNGLISGMSLQDVFIEEAGKTKTLELKNVADKKTISLIQPGDSVALAVKRSKIFVQMPNKTYIGMLPDSIGMRMISLINGGNEYSACVKSVEDKSITVFIRETKRASKFKNQPSFSITAPMHPEI